MFTYACLSGPPHGDPFDGAPQTSDARINDALITDADPMGADALVERRADQRRPFQQ